MENNLDTYTTNICRTCLGLTNSSISFEIDFTDANTTSTIGDKLKTCMPELDLSITSNATICKECHDAIDFVYQFRSTCLQSEVKIHKYQQQMPYKAKPIDLIEVAQFNCVGTLADVKLEAEIVFKEEVVVAEEEEDVEVVDLCDDSENSFSLFTSTNNRLINFDNCDSESSTECPQNNFDQKDVDATPINSFTRKYYQCLFCSYFTAYKCLFNNHLRTHLTKIALRHKNFRFSIKLLKKNRNKCVEEVNKRTRTKTRKKTFKCSECEYRGNSEQFFKIHCLFHNKEKPPKDQANESNKSHTQNQTGEPLDRCKFCGFQCSKETFKKHMLIHSRKTLFYCPCCGFQSRDRTQLTSHMLQHRKEENLFVAHLGRDYLQTNSEYQCLYCEYKTDDENVLKMHIEKHTNRKRHHCSLCDFQCNYGSSLKRHMLRHSTKMLFQCQHCDYQCNYKFLLRSHMLKHTGKNLFKCTYCKYQGNRKDNLKAHLLTHVQDKLYKCDLCQYQCNRRDSLRTHVLKHTIQEIFKCTYCEFQSDRKEELTLHMTAHS